MVHKNMPQFRITVSSAGYGGGTSSAWINDKAISGQITRNENGFDTGVLRVEDYKALTWIDKLDVEGSIVIDFKDAAESTWTEVFDGIIRFLDLPRAIDSLILHCDGKGFPLGEMLCKGEYGTQSANPTLDKIQEIITDAAEGIIPEYVNDILNTGVASNHSITANVTTVEDIAGSLTYLYNPYKPCSNSIDDICDIVQAIKGANPGPHWIVDVSGNFLLCTLGASHPDAATNGWTLYYGNSQANATLVQDIDFIDYSFQKLAKEANYILYHGATIKPMNMDALTESYAASWAGTAATFADDSDAGDFVVGANSIHVTENTGGVLQFVRFGTPLAGGWNINALGGKYNIPIIHFWSKIDTDMWTNNESIEFSFFPANLAVTDCITTPAVALGVQSIYPAADRWAEFILPIGQYANYHKDMGPDWFTGWSTWGLGTWTGPFYFGAWWQSNTNTQEMFFDGLYVKGSVLRAAYDSTIGATNPVKMKLITDEVAKDDMWTAADDSGTIARLAKAELYRCKNTPIVGWIKVPCIYDLLPGQFLHIHAKKKLDGTFRIDKDMRVTSLTHNFSVDGFITTIQLTDDVTNALTRSSFNNINKVMKSIRPEFQDRQASSIKAREIDITQPLLSVSY